MSIKSEMKRANAFQETCMDICCEMSQDFYVDFKFKVGFGKFSQEEKVCSVLNIDILIYLFAFES